jgi:hypothetical protein
LLQQGSLIWDRGFFAFDSVKGMLINESSPLFQIKEPVAIDYLILCGQPKFKPGDLGNNLNVRKLIIDGSVPLWIVNQWIKDRNAVDYHLLDKQGAYIEIIK